MPLFSLGYRRPAYVQPAARRNSEASLPVSTTSTGSNEKSDASLRSGRSGTSAGIPTALAFDKIIDGGTCPVSITLTVRRTAY